jgi:hypothetical protein
MADQVSPTTRSSYQLGWDDGYVEGYACKLVDVTEPFMPSGDIPQIEAAADWLMRKHALVFTIRSEAIGIARGMIAAMKGVSSNG